MQRPNSKTSQRSQLRLQLLNQEDAYESTKAVNALQRAQIAKLETRLERLKKASDLSQERQQEVVEVKLELALLKEYIEQQHQELTGLKGLFQKIWDYFRPPDW